jgi:ATP-dependent helicase/nuclease subunit B
MIPRLELNETKKWAVHQPQLPFPANKLLCDTAALGEKFLVQARFLLGPAGSGKTFRCLAEIRAALRENPEGEPLVLLAPKQATFQLERQLLGWGESPREPKSNFAYGSSGASPHQINGYIRLQILSFERLARFVLEKFSIAPPKLLSEEGRVMVLRALLLQHEDRLKLFRRSARRPGFAQELSALLNEFQQHQLTPAKLHALSQRDGLPAELRDKLNDLALVAENYSHRLAEHELQDASQLLDLATEALQRNSRFPLSAFRFSSLWLDGFAEMTPQESDLLAAVLPFCEHATLAFCLDERSAGGSPANSGPAAPHSWLSIWNAVGRTYSECRRRVEPLPDCTIKLEILPSDMGKNRFAKNSALAHLEKCWTQPPPSDAAIRSPQSAISITSCANADAEAVFAAREILKFARDKSARNRFRDCAVLVRNLESYHQPLARTFRRYDIPFFLDRRESVAHHPLAELTRGALRTAAFDWRHDDWFAALKAGFCPIAEDKIDRLENAALEFGWRGKKWHAPLPDENYERLRQKILPSFENFAAHFARLKNTPTGAQLVDALHELWHALHVEATLEKWSAPEAESPSLVTRRSSPHTTVWDQMNAWLDNLALAFPREPLSLRDWLPIIEAGLSNLTVGVIPPVLDEVLIGAVDRARNPDLKFALVLGMNEGIFPAAPAPAAILTDADRDELGQTVSLGPDLRERLARERYYGYIACTRASEKLAVTFSRHDTDGKALNPSPFVAQLRQIFPALEIEEFQNEIGLGEAGHASELAPLLVKLKAPHPGPLPASRGEGEKLRNARDDSLSPPKRGEGEGEGRSENWDNLLKIPALNSLAEQLRQLHEPSKGEILSSAQAEKLYGPVLQSSVSRLEEFAQCPFRFFVHSGLRAEERKVFELDARERGSFQHEVLKIFHEQLAAEGKRWRDLTPQQARERVAQIAAGLVKNFRQGLMRDTAQTRFEARAMAEVLQDFIAAVVSWMREQYEFDPAAAELDFGSKASPETAWEIALGADRRLALRGRIDRVDLCRDPGRPALAVVVDYKSGGKKLDALMIENGVQLQLLAYLNALRHWKNPRAIFGVDQLIPAGVFYVNLRGQYEGGKTRDEVLGAADAQKLAYRHNGRFDVGALPKLDRAGAADQFNYRLNQDGSLRKGSTEALPRAEFEKLLDGVETRLKEMGRAIFSGTASVNPYRKGAETACDFCDYAAVCRIDPWTHQWRMLRAKEKVA